ncbi:MAG: PAS domain-containing protein, partial [Anaerolineae bacterium]|nr:PAS domain-containing protein [Anaerolineae bacterium]
MDVNPNRTDLTFDSVSVALCAVDGAGKILHVNPALEQLLGWDAAERVGQPLARCLQETIPEPAQALAWTVALSEAITWGKTTHLNAPTRFRLASSEGSLEDITGVILAISRGQERDPGAVVVIYGPEVLASTAGGRARLFSAISHELGSPLNNISAATRLLAGTADSLDERQGRLLGILQDEVARLQRLVAQLVAEPPAVESHRTLTTHVVTLRPLLHRVSQVFDLPGSENSIVLQIQADLPFVAGDADAIHQVAQDLLDG